MIQIWWIVVSWVLVLGAIVGAQEVEQNLTMYKGEAVEAVEYALTHPTAPDALDSVYKYGTDGRLYVMIRGWLVQELAGVQSILGSLDKDAPQQKTLQEYETFLKRAIRRIDLE